MADTLLDLQNSLYPNKADLIIHLKYYPFLKEFCCFTLCFSARQKLPCPQVSSVNSFNLQRAALLTSLVQCDKVLSKFGQQQLAMVHYVCGFNQSEMGKYLDCLIIQNYSLSEHRI